MRQLTVAKENAHHHPRSCVKQHRIRWEWKTAFSQHECEKGFSLLNGLDGWSKRSQRQEPSQEAQMSPVGSKKSHGKRQLPECQLDVHMRLKGFYRMTRRKKHKETSNKAFSTTWRKTWEWWLLHWIQAGEVRGCLQGRRVFPYIPKITKLH